VQDQKKARVLNLMEPDIFYRRMKKVNFSGSRMLIGLIVLGLNSPHVAVRGSEFFRKVY
jgi:hypothetical protein